MKKNVLYFTVLWGLSAGIASTVNAATVTLVKPAKRINAGGKRVLVLQPSNQIVVPRTGSHESLLPTAKDPRVQHVVEQAPATRDLATQPDVAFSVAPTADQSARTISAGKAGSDPGMGGRLLQLRSDTYTPAKGYYVQGVGWVAVEDLTEPGSEDHEKAIVTPMHQLARLVKIDHKDNAFAQLLFEVGTIARSPNFAKADSLSSVMIDANHMIWGYKGAVTSRDVNRRSHVLLRLRRLLGAGPQAGRDAALNIWFSLGQGGDLSIVDGELAQHLLYLEHTDEIVRAWRAAGGLLGDGAAPARAALPAPQIAAEEAVALTAENDETEDYDLLELTDYDVIEADQQLMSDAELKAARKYLSQSTASE